MRIGLGFASILQKSLIIIAQYINFANSSLYQGSTYRSSTVNAVRHSQMDGHSQRLIFLPFILPHKLGSVEVLIKRINNSIS